MERVWKVEQENMSDKENAAEVADITQTKMCELLAGLPTEPVLRGDALLFRPIMIEDTEQFLKWRNHEDISRWFVYRTPITAQAHMEWMLEHIVRERDCVQFIVFAPETERTRYIPIGMTNIRSIDRQERSGEYGIFIGNKAVRGKGYGTEILRVMTAYAMDVLNLKILRARAYVDNQPSVKHFLRGGFQIVSTLKDVVSTDGEIGDMYMMELRK